MSAPDESALDALAAALAPRVLRLLREQAGCDDGLADLLAASGFELDDAATALPAVSAATPRRKGKAA